MIFTFSRASPWHASPNVNNWLGAVLGATRHLLCNLSLQPHSRGLRNNKHEKKNDPRGIAPYYCKMKNKFLKPDPTLKYN